VWLGVKVNWDAINVLEASVFDQSDDDAPYKANSLVEESFELSIVLATILDKLLLDDIKLKLGLLSENWSKFLTFLSALKKFKLADFKSLNL
jgi:hypothetical protein